MPEITLSPVTDLADRKVREVAKRVLHTFLIASEKAVASQVEPAAYKLPAESNAVEHVFLARFRSLAPEIRQAASSRVMSLVKAPTAQRATYFGDLADLDLHAARPVTELAKARAFPAALRFPLAHIQELKLHGGVLLQGLVPQQTTNKLEFRIHKVRCVDETNPEWLGDDEIALGGTTVDETGDAKKVAQFTVRNDFDDGEQKVYAPPKQFTWFSLAEGGNVWPKSYFVTLVLAEKDMGGLADFLNKLLDAVKGHVIEALGAAIGGVIGSIGGPLAAVIGAAVGWIVGKIFEWLKSWWSDDVFPPKTLSISIPSMTHRWAGGATDSPEGVVRFSGHGGTYDLTYDWRMFG
jgi:hypothetical protein